VGARRLTAGVVALSLLIAFALGGLHALSPGHGKTVVAAYLVGSRGTARHALLLGAVVTASHTIGVFLLGIVTLALSKAIVPEKLYPAIQLLSGLTIVAIGGSLFVRRWRRRTPEEHGHSHAIEVPESAPTASALLALGVSGGILPCPSALVVLLSAIALHRVGFGLVLIVAFSAGLAAVLSGIGILVVRAGRLLSRFDAAGGWARRRLPAFSALLIGLLGAAIAVRAFPDVQHAFFLR
jgi:ABC-type nickel/cobalt efflux system permease component RcnA